MNRSIAAILVATLAACGSGKLEPLTHESLDGAFVTVTVAPGSYAAGAVVPLTVSSFGDEEYVWNPCLRSLERLTDREWITVDEPERVCPLEGWILPSGGRTEAATGLPASLPGGEYRFRYDFSRLAGDYYDTDYQVSNPFTVTP